MAAASTAKLPAHRIVCSGTTVCVAFGPHLAALDVVDSKPVLALNDKVDATIRCLAAHGSTLVSVADDKALKVSKSARTS